MTTYCSGPGRLVVADEGGDIVHIDVYRTNDRTTWMRISVPRGVLRLYAERLLAASNRAS